MFITWKKEQNVFDVPMDSVSVVDVVNAFETYTVPYHVLYKPFKYLIILDLETSDLSRTMVVQHNVVENAKNEGKVIEKGTVGCKVIENGKVEHENDKVGCKVIENDKIGVELLENAKNDDKVTEKDTVGCKVIENAKNDDNIMDVINEVVRHVRHVQNTTKNVQNDTDCLPSQFMVDYIPVITQVGAIVYNFNKFMTSENTIAVMDSGVVFNKRRCTKRADTAQFIWNIINEHKDCLVVAHNGFGFDYKIILSYLLKYGDFQAEKMELLKKVKFYDSLVAVKKITQMRHNSHKNCDLFAQYAQNYTCKLNLLKEAHEAVADCYMTTAWCHSLRKYLKFNTYTDGGQLLKFYEQRLQRLMQYKPSKAGANTISGRSYTYRKRKLVETTIKKTPFTKEEKLEKLRQNVRKLGTKRSNVQN